MIKKTLAVLFAALGGCASSNAVLTDAGPKCIPLETSARFSCWWSSDTAPLTHCVMRDEDEPQCNLRQKAAVYFDRGAYIARVLDRPSQGSWIVLPVTEDVDGRIVQKATDASGNSSLIDHSETPIKANATAPTEPTQPRWPSGIEFGPAH